MEYFFEGTPKQFRDAVSAYISRTNRRIFGIPGPITVRYGGFYNAPREERDADINLVTIYFRAPDTDEPIGTMIAQRLPNGRSLLTVQADAALWLHWQLLNDDFLRLGLIVGNTITDQERDKPLLVGEIRRYPNNPSNATLTKLEQLHTIRMQPKTKRPGWIKACLQVEIEPRTAAKHDPELKKHWNDSD